VRARFEAATALWAIVSTLSEAKAVHPHFEADGAPQLPRPVYRAILVLFDEPIDGWLRLT